MHRLILAAIVALVITPAQADLCGNIEQLAQTIMTKRQEGAALGEMLDVANKADDADVSELARGITMMAFEEPAYRTPEVKARTIVQFGNKLRLQCERALR